MNYLIFLFGLTTFVLTTIADIARGKRKELGLYISDLVYTIISIAIGFFISIVLSFNEAGTYIIVISMGMIGSTIIEKFLQRKNHISENIVDNTLKKINVAPPVPRPSTSTNIDESTELSTESSKPTKPTKPAMKPAMEADLKVDLKVNQLDDIPLTPEDEEYLKNL
jgi:hypothetical protein